MSQFKGKVALITGGSAGIGRAAAVAFAREGAKVVVASRRQKESEETLDLVRQAGSEGLFVQTDVSKSKDVKTMVEKTIDKYGRLDFAFNNAGVLLEGQETNQNGNEEIFDQIMDINVKGVWLSMQYEIPELLKTGGAIVNTSSILGTIGAPGAPIYVASKHAVIGLTKATALKFAKQGIRVNAVAPAAIETDMYHGFAKDEKARAQFAALHPIGRAGEPEEVAGAVIWLCSPSASFVTGQTLLIDGGYTVQ
jgi:NAD(P)-dependent dehydrogenase (short-subunit alcohol dehydrogenase family)